MTPPTGRRRVALVSMHTSPTARPGAGDAGGMNVYLASVAGPLVAQGLDVDLLTRRVHPDEPRMEDLASGARLVRVEAGPLEALAKGRLARHVGEFAEGMAHIADYDLVHSHYWLSGVAGLAVARALEVPHVLSLHTVAALKNATLPHGDAPEPAHRVRWERDLARASALTVAATRAEATAIETFYGIGPDAVDVITPGVDHGLFRPDGALPGGRPGDLLRSRPSGYLLMVGRTQPLKGQDLAIEALAAMDPATRPPLVLAGDTSPGHEAYRAHLQDLVRDLGLVDDVDFEPAVTRAELARLLRGAALLLVPSHSETFGLVSLEAAASGLPVVAARVGGLAEAVSDGVSGVLVDGFDPHVWAGTVARLLGDADALAAMRAGARAYAVTFSWQAVAERLAADYRTLLPGGRS